MSSLSRWIVLLVLASPGFARAGIAFYAGLPDPTFGNGGVVHAPKVDTDVGITGFDLMADGHIVAAGRYEYDALLVQYLADGSLDPSFGVDGVVTVALGAGISSYAGVAVQPDGKAVVIGTHAHFPGEPLVARHDDVGVFDADFGTDGIVFLGPFGVDAVAGSPRIQPDGRILVGGAATGGPVLVRLDDGGELDPTFGIGGLASLDVGPSPASSTLAGHLLLPDGRIVVLVQATPGPGAAVLVLARYDASGILDPTLATAAWRW